MKQDRSRRLKVEQKYNDRSYKSYIYNPQKIVCLFVAYQPIYQEDVGEGELSLQGVDLKHGVGLHPSKKGVEC